MNFYQSFVDYELGEMMIVLISIRMLVRTAHDTGQEISAVFSALPTQETLIAQIRALERQTQIQIQLEIQIHWRVCWPPKQW